jgi:transposase
MTPENHLVNRFILPDLKLIKFEKISNKTFHLHCVKKTDWEVCRKCPTKSFKVYDHRTVSPRDSKLHNKNIRLIIYKRRFKCPNCGAVFTEAIDGIKVGFRTTEKYRSTILHDSKNYDNIKSVAKVNRCSDTLVTTIVNERLELELRKSRNTPWGKTVCIDEHGFKRNQKKSRKEMVTSLVDNNRKCVREVAPSKNPDDIKATIEHIPGRENVKNAVIDMDDTFKNFILGNFPNAEIVVDKFHVVRLIHPAIGKYRREVTGDVRKNPIRFLLLKNRKKLEKHQKKAVARFCNENPKVGEVYRYKERISGFYRIKGYKQASRTLIKITDDMALSKLPEIQTLRKTLMKWRKEILQYFKTGLTNARVEGFNRKCKLIQRKAYGFKNFENYRLRVLYSCS